MLLHKNNTGMCLLRMSSKICSNGEYVVNYKVKSSLVVAFIYLFTYKKNAKLCDINVATSIG